MDLPPQDAIHAEVILCDRGQPTAPRLGVHPGTSLPLVVPARKKVAFTAAGSLKAALAGEHPPSTDQTS